MTSKPPRDQTPEHSQWTIQRYGRFWAVYDQDTLVVVTVYKKGALEVIDRLATLQSPHAGKEVRDGRPPT